jgi:Ran GTPase-activating protein (RanGAP) involved in mRNA processing and transport
MRPEIPDWLEELAQQLSENDLQLTSVELTHQRINDAQARFLANAMKENSVVHTFILSCFAIYDDGALALSSILEKSKSIKKLQLRDLRNSRDMIMFFQSLNRNTSMEEFSLRHSQICVQSARYFSDLLKTKKLLQEVRIVDTQMSPNTFSKMCSGISESLSLRRLYLVNVDIDADSGGRCLNYMLRTNKSLCELYLSENQLGDEGTSFLVDGLLENKTLTKLDLRSNEIGVEGALSLAVLVKQSLSLTALYIGMNELGNVGAETLSHGLTYSRLNTLDISDNNIGPHGAHALSKMLQTNTKLYELNLSFNLIGDEGASAIANTLDKNATLRCLSLRRNYIGKQGALALGAKLPVMRGLKELVMIKNNICQDGAIALLNGLRRNVELEYLHVEDKVSEPILREIVHWIRLNRAGRRIVRNNKIPYTLWPKVLSNINHDVEVLHHFLLMKPDVFQYLKKREQPIE